MATKTPMTLAASLIVDNLSRELACAIFIHQTDPFPGGHKYELVIPAGDIDDEVLGYARFRTMSNPDRQTASHWFFWLGHIISRKYKKDDDAFDSSQLAVLNSIIELSFDDTALRICGESSNYVGPQDSVTPHS
jgi:hypothetical protein